MLCKKKKKRRHLLGRQPGVDKVVQGVLVVRAQPRQQGLDGDGSHLLAAGRVVIDHDQGERHEEELFVLRQHGLRSGGSGSTLGCY